MNKDYVAGFMAKAAALGVDPEALANQQSEQGKLGLADKLSLMLTGSKYNMSQGDTFRERMKNSMEGMSDMALHHASGGYHGLSRAHGGKGITLPGFKRDTFVSDNRYKAAN
jgi:uncharacterized cupredoxin-like copper-binding protein